MASPSVIKTKIEYCCLQTTPVSKLFQCLIQMQFYNIYAAVCCAF